ncbi:MAG TPA: HEAT repeat domain-containing protein [Gemmatimonadales bacterium]|nr:HEAT repeat domain-containing protein [Gemmatimonadales bacterium]
MIARVGLGLALVGAPVAAQHLEARIRAAPAGVVRLTFAARPDVCGTDRGVGMSGRRRSGLEEVAYDCPPGPVRVSLTVRDGTVESVRTYVGGRWVSPAPGATVTDLGTVATRAAADFLLALAAQDRGRASRDAIFPATLADSVTVWPRLLALARDERVSGPTRRQAIFWLGQAAEDAATHGLTALVDDTTADRAVKEQAVFALSQRPRAEGIPALLRIARTHPEAAVRRRALFWLGQSDDPRALALFEELLTQP